MWFSGLRGAIAYALSLHLEFGEETRKVVVTTTLVVVLFTTIVLGGGTMPLMKYLERRTISGRAGRRRRKRDITMSKTSEFGAAIDSEHLSELTSGGRGTSPCPRLASSGRPLTASTCPSLPLEERSLRPLSPRARLTSRGLCSGITSTSGLSSLGSFLHKSLKMVKVP